MNSEKIISELKKSGTAEKIAILSRFFKTGKCQYGEGDIFLGVTVPEQRKIAKKYKEIINLNDISLLLDSEYHEARLTGLILLMELIKMKHDIEEIVALYSEKFHRINNWDLVDLSAPNIIGFYYYERDRTPLYKIAESDNLWENRIAIVSTLYFIRKNDFKDTIHIANILFNHKHDLIHKAVGWMLREMGKRDINTLNDYLKEKYKIMPRTMLRYAIEKYPADIRKLYLKGEI